MFVGRVIRPTEVNISVIPYGVPPITPSHGKTGLKQYSSPLKTQRDYVGHKPTQHGRMSSVHGEMPKKLGICYSLVYV
jgi:hypothetical protein